MRETEKERDRQTDRERDRDRETERETERGKKRCLLQPENKKEIIFLTHFAANKPPITKPPPLNRKKKERNKTGTYIDLEHHPKPDIIDL